MSLRRPSGAQLEQWQPRLWLILVGLLAIVAYVIAFVIKNDDEIEIDFVFFTTEISLIWEILLMLGIGVLGGVLLSQLYRRQRRNEPR
ncbi:MAG: LapA family protein [Actinomycetota bacterium]|nr:LapA family protein [Actinomycetota bacterium]